MIYTFDKYLPLQCEDYIAQLSRLTVFIMFQQNSQLASYSILKIML